MTPTEIRALMEKPSPAYDDLRNLQNLRHHPEVLTVWLGRARTLTPFWETVPKGQVNLNFYTHRDECGSVHCFGGWIAARGLYGVKDHGYPSLGVLAGTEVSRWLFGGDLFGERSRHNLTAWHEAKLRIDTLIHNLEQKLKEVTT